MAVYDTLSLVKTTSLPNGATSRLFHFLLPAGDIDSVRVKLEGANAGDDIVFNFAVDGTPITTTELTMLDGTNEIEATGLAETVTNDQWGTLSIDSPFVSGSLDGITAIGLHVTYDVTLGGGLTEYTSASGTAPGSLYFAEDTDNGTNKVTVTAPASIASDKTQTLQDITDTFVYRTSTDTLTNKTLTSPVINTPTAAIITSLTEETTIADADFVMLYDASASALRKMQKSNLVAGLTASANFDTIITTPAGDEIIFHGGNVVWNA